jgi:O-antigen ligase
MFTRNRLTEALAAYCLCCTIIATVAMFESVKHWLLYVDLYSRWGGSLMETEYLFRNHLLRAVSATGNALALGYMLAVAFGLWLYLQSRMPRSWRTVMVTIVLLLGLGASMSRGPWLGAVAIYFGYAALGPRFRLLRAAVLFLAVFGVILLSPIGNQLTSTLPFMGGRIAESSLDYRERLAGRAWQLIQERPFLGDQLALSKMQNLRQGQGIIDIVNTYLDVALFRGFLGLALFLGFILVALARARRAARSSPAADPDGARLGANLSACMLGTLLMLADCSFIQGYAQMYYILGGLAVAYFSLWVTRESRAAAARAAHSESVEFT